VTKEGKKMVETVTEEINDFIETLSLIFNPKPI
jgi:PadR family transcriptional regulator PadR